MKVAGMLCAVLSLFLTAACTDRRPAPISGERYVISNDGGGQIISAQADRARLRFGPDGLKYAAIALRLA